MFLMQIYRASSVFEVTFSVGYKWKPTYNQSYLPAFSSFISLSNESINIAASDFTEKMKRHTQVLKVIVNLFDQKEKKRKDW